MKKIMKIVHTSIMDLLQGFSFVLSSYNLLGLLESSIFILRISALFTIYR